MSLFTHEARQFKFDVLREVARRSFEGKINEDTIDEISSYLIPTNKADFRCCVYKEREIIRERTRLALGKSPNTIRKDSYSSKQIVHVLEAACDGCSIHKVTVTDNCRKCMAKSCQEACKFGAISMGAERAFIDYDKCKSCGACAKACPFSAIVQSERPCVRSCPVNAISMDENDLCIIDEAKCISCGACQAGCPFGAISDISFMHQVIEDINNKEKLVAIVAPAIQGQMETATLPQIMSAIRQVGFSDVIEAAVGADAVADIESKEILHHKQENIKVTTSCCPAFVNMARIHFPTVYEKNVSKVVSPMEAAARYIKGKDSSAKVVFIGPCVAKKQEAMGDWSVVDYVLTFEEIAAMITACNIDVSQVVPSLQDQASLHGKNFAIGGGVSKAVVQSLKENQLESVSAKYADGAAECKMNLLLMKLGKFNEDVLEGMACVGGCINGPATIESPLKAKQVMAKQNASIKDKTIQSTLDQVDFSQVNMHR
ncbi:MAG: monomeric [FeFe] hydrogenase [Traorella sp.]